MVYPISDMLNRIRNANAVFQETVDIPFSNFKFEITRIMAENGFIEKFEKRNIKNHKSIRIFLKYNTDSENKKNPVISGLKVVSKPGQRIYKKTKDIKPVKGKYGMAIFSTPKGVMTNNEAKKRKLGGELIAEIW